MTNKELCVFIEGKHAGTLTQDSSGSVSFSYLEGYRGVCLSSAIPLSTRAYRNKIVLPYLWGLLPEDLAVRTRIARDAGISPNNPVALLAAIGLDCPGAVQFCQKENDILRDERLIPISNADIALRLAQGRQAGGSWVAQEERWSLGGQQSKFALRRQSSKWYSCQGSAATSHILKSGVQTLPHQALDEYVCMRLARECGIHAANVEYKNFHNRSAIEPAIIIERYDRLEEDGHIIRLHQEDLCQALGCLPSSKYTMDGGPSASDVIKLLLTTKSEAAGNVARFLQMLFFNYLIAGSDAHAKNYSLMLAPDGAHRLAPMYDVASIAPYIDPARWGVKPPKLAMSIGGENRAGNVTLANLGKMVEQCDLAAVGITTKGCARLIVMYAEMIPEKLAKVFDELESSEHTEAAKALRATMEQPIAELCQRSIKKLHG